jgi:hypothetical protein
MLAFTISYGDEPEALDVVLDIMRDAGAVMETEVIATGADFYRREIKDGFLPDIFDSLKRTKLLLKSITKKPKGDYEEVTKAICTKLEINTKLEYFVCEDAPGVGIVTETSEEQINTDVIAEIYKASAKLGGQNFAYAIDELGLMFETEGKNFASIKPKYMSIDDIKANFKDQDVIFIQEKSATELKKAMKPKYGCNIYLGNGYAIFEPIDDYNKDGKGLLLAAALILKYAGQGSAAWEVYGKLEG